MKYVKRLIISVLLWLCIVLSALYAKSHPEFVTEYFTPFSRKVSFCLGKVMSFFPHISVGELLIFVAAATFILCLVLTVAGKMKLFNFLTLLTICVSVGVAVYFFSWGLNNYSQPLSETLNIQTEKYSEDELYEATLYYLGKANSLSTEVDRNDAGDVILPTLYETGLIASESYANVAKTYPQFSQKSFPAKGFLTSETFAKFDLTGMYIPFTGECNVVKSTPGISMPHTVTHEYAHYYGIGKENEANFVGYLACEQSDCIEFRYSGYYTAFVYCYNALSDSSRQSVKLFATQEFSSDLSYVYNHYKKYEGTAEKIGEKINDTYLKAVDQPSGVKSYGEVVDLLIAYYQQNYK